MTDANYCFVEKRLNVNKKALCSSEAGPIVPQRTMSTNWTSPRGTSLHQSLRLIPIKLSRVGHGQVEPILPFHKEQILRIKPSKLGVPDELFWLKNTSGEYSTRSGYLTLTEEKESMNPLVHAVPCDWLSNIWNVKTS